MVSPEILIKGIVKLSKPLKQTEFVGVFFQAEFVKACRYVKPKGA